MFILHPSKFFQPCKMQLCLSGFPVEHQTYLRQTWHMPSHYVFCWLLWNSKQRRCIFWCIEKCHDISHIVFWIFYSTQCRKCEWKEEKNVVKTVAGKPDVITEVDQNKGSTSEITQDFEIPLSTLLTYLKSVDSIQQQAFQWVVFQNTWQYVEQSMAIWKMSCFNCFAMLDRTVLPWMARRWKGSVMKYPCRWALILTAPLDDCTSFKRDGTLHYNQWAEKVLQQMLILHVSGKNM